MKVGVERTLMSGMMALAWACHPSQEPIRNDTGLASSTDSAVLVPLDSPRLLRRMSLDLRGVLPALDELDAVEEDESLLSHYRDVYLEDPRLEERLVHLFQQRFQTRLDRFEVRWYDYFLEAEQEHEFEKSIGEEPLRLMAHVATEDLPWTDIVTADYTLANEMLAGIWPLDYPADGEGWEVSTYTDGRPAGGVLVSNGLWWRYVTSKSNMNRSRAAAISRLLLCQDILSRPVSLVGAVALSDEDGTAEAIQNNPSCVACHATLEPLSAALFGFWTVISYNPLELSNYHSEREKLGEEVLGVAPGYYGQPIEGLVELGPAIATDPRFYSCAVETAASLLWRREIESDDFPQVEALRVQFVSSKLRYRELIRAVVDTPEYRAGSFTDAATDADLDREQTWRLVTPELWASMLEELTGFWWTAEGFEQLANGNPGYRVMAGGVDGYEITRPQQDPGMTWALTIQRTAQAAADYAVQQELVEGAERHLFQWVDLENRPGDEAFEQELGDLYWRLYARHSTETERSAIHDLWSAVELLDGPAAAWTSVLSVLLRDPEGTGL